MIGILVATIAGFVISATYYALAPVTPGSEADPAAAPPAAAQAAIELVRSAAVAGLLAGIVTTAGWTTPGEGALLGLALWTIPVVLLVGSVVHEGTRARTAGIHAGDWLMKLVAIGAIVGWLA